MSATPSDMKWITIDQLDIWARTLQARTELPELVADLIRASASDRKSVV